MTTRRKTGKLRKKQAALRKTAATSRPPAPGRRRADAAAQVRLGHTASGTAAALGVLPAECTIAQADELKSRLLPALIDPAPVTLDLAAVRRIDTAALQVLSAFVRERRAAGREVACRGASQPFLLVAEILGLAALFAAAPGGPPASSAPGAA